MKNLKQISVSVVAALFTFVLVYGGYSYATVGEDLENALGALCDIGDEESLTPDQYANSSTYACIKAKYHYEMNQFFNEKMNLAIEIIRNEPDFTNDERFTVPQINSELERQRECQSERAGDEALCMENKKKEEIRELCAGNVSTYCVAMQGMYRYVDYLQTLQVKKSLLPDLDEAMAKDEGVFIQTNTLWVLANRSAQVNSNINEEIVNAGRVLEGAVSTYDEFLVAYPMHERYEEIIENLIKYKLKLKQIRNHVNHFPGKFVDITSITCP